MARSYLIFGDIEGKLDMLRVECTRCGRNPNHRSVDRLKTPDREVRVGFGVILRF